MALNWDTNDTYIYVDKKYKMMIQHHGTDSGKGDAIGRNMDAYWVYEDYRFIEGIKDCWVKIKKSMKLFGLIPFRNYYYQGYRYPDHVDTDLSRDHALNTIQAYKLAGMPDKELQEFVKHLKWKISDRYSFVPDTWLSIRAIAGMKWARVLFYSIEIPVMLFNMLRNKYVYKKYKIEDEVPQHEYVHVPNSEKRPEFSEFVPKLFPVYALGNLARQLNLMEDSLGKKILYRIIRKMVLKHNYVIRMLINDFEPTEENRKLVYDYKSMKGGRWSTSLNEVNDRHLYILDDKLVEYNAIDVDLVRKLFEKIKK